MQKFVTLLLLLQLPVHFTALQHLLSIYCWLVVVYSYLICWGTANCYHDVLSRAERQPVISAVGMSISKDEWGSGCFNEIGGLFAVKPLVPAHDEIVSFDDLGLFWIIGVPGHRGIQFVKMLCDFYLLHCYYKSKLFKYWISTLKLGKWLLNGAKNKLNRIEPKNKRAFLGNYNYVN